MTRLTQFLNKVYGYFRILVVGSVILLVVLTVLKVVLPSEVLAAIVVSLVFVIMVEIVRQQKKRRSPFSVTDLSMHSLAILTFLKDENERDITVIALAVGATSSHELSSALTVLLRHKLIEETGKTTGAEVEGEELKFSKYRIRQKGIDLLNTLPPPD